MKRHNKQQETEAQIDLTPMLDVVFIMLIFFIVTATFIKEVSIALERPDKSNAPPNAQDIKNILIEVHPDNQLYIDKLRIDKRALRAYFQRHQAENPEAVVIIKAHNQSKTAMLVTIADAANAADMKGVSVDNVDAF